MGDTWRDGSAKSKFFEEDIAIYKSLVKNALAFCDFFFLYWALHLRHLRETHHPDIFLVNSDG